MRRFTIVVMPILSVVTSLIGLYFLYVGARTIAAGRYVALGTAFAGFGAVGPILAYALWNVRRQLMARMAVGREG